MSFEYYKTIKQFRARNIFFLKKTALFYGAFITFRFQRMSHQRMSHQPTQICRESEKLNM